MALSDFPFHPDVPFFQPFKSLASIKYPTLQPGGKAVSNEGLYNYGCRVFKKYKSLRCWECCDDPDVKRDEIKTESRVVMLFIKALRFGSTSDLFDAVSAGDLTSLSSRISKGELLYSLCSKTNRQLIVSITDTLVKIKAGNLEKREGIKQIDGMIQEFYQRKRRYFDEKEISGNIHAFIYDQTVARTFIIAPQKLAILQDLTLEETTMITPYRDRGEKMKFAASLVNTIKSGFFRTGIENNDDFKNILKSIQDEEIFDLVEEAINQAYKANQGSWGRWTFDTLTLQTSQIKERKRTLDEVLRDIRKEIKAEGGFVGYESPASEQKSAPPAPVLVEPKEAEPAASHAALEPEDEGVGVGAMPKKVSAASHAAVVKPSSLERFAPSIRPIQAGDMELRRREVYALAERAQGTALFSYALQGEPQPSSAARLEHPVSPRLVPQANSAPRLEHPVSPRLDPQAISEPRLEHPVSPRLVPQAISEPGQEEKRALKRAEVFARITKAKIPFGAVKVMPELPKE